MADFERIREALRYIDEHLDEEIGFEDIARVFHFSPYYFHRMFSVVVGKPMVAHIRDRRLEKAGQLLSRTRMPVLAVGMDCGFNSYTSFGRAFVRRYSVSPREYRRLGRAPESISVDEMIANLEKRLKGGVLMEPKLIERGEMLIAGTSGDGSRTGEIWDRFMELHNKIGLRNRVSDNGYEVRIYHGNKCECHVGMAVMDEKADSAFSVFRLPASKYASFDVYVARGYDSGNSAMDEWLEANKSTYVQSTYEGKPYAVEFYDERFKGNEADSIVEIWVPIADAVPPTRHVG